ncbi:uncharacterized protein LOC115188784 isoform X1 [Salmo trutta]|uniref:uncharacterized protein LOC115186265 isoform X1 n=2 Tax=Salmo trutta TaxID=8032 RepID=UPI001130C94B|nr:uncharacterized protein LOC115186265 isoform X1 [Salmo trutta]XP_029603445.1 uncharacterized protein LOC115188764 isoform X1 [Salmo trutta]XP_029603495.1 uncharacterized protein LOC115188784 isoform X1 [Salmo trutta]
MFFKFDLDFVTFFLCVCVSHASRVMLDVLIIGGGPHALTLATLLSCPDQALSPPPPNTDILQGIQLSQGRAKTSRSKNKRGGATRQQTAEPEEQAAPDPESVSSCPPLAFRVVDSYGAWTSLWESQFRALNIPHLRSHTLVHTDPLNKRALQEFVLEKDRTAELHCLPDHTFILDENAFFNDMRLGKKDRRRLSSSRGLQKSLYFSLPGTRLSVDFFRQQVDKYGLDSVLTKGTVDRLTPVMSEGIVTSFRVFLQNGDVLEAKRVVMATGPTRAQMANIPFWVSSIAESYPEERLQHTVQLMHHHPASRPARQQEPRSQNQEQEESSSSFSSAGPYVVCEPGQRVVVVGGGLTSAHIISIALQQGASHVTWVMRKHLQLKQFDVGDVESLVGRYSHVEHGIKMDGLAYLRQFYNESSVHKRLAMIRQARKGGAVTPEAYAALQPYIQNGQLAVRAYCQVTEAKWCYESQVWRLSLCGQNGCETWTGDRIWLATGCKLDVNQDPMLSSVIKEFPIQVLDGWPCISESLQWAPGCPLYLMGQYTALQVGPHALNLAGGQAASARIAKDIIFQHSQSGDGGTGTQTTVERAHTEEYIQQMHGLMWL